MSRMFQVAIVSVRTLAAVFICIYNHTNQKKPNKNKKKIEKNMGQIRAPNGQKGTT
jgi:hypothetical protein